MFLRKGGTNYTQSTDMDREFIERRGAAYYFTGSRVTLDLSLIHIFNEVERGELPLKAWKDCLRCPKFHSCDEIAVLRVLRPQRWEQRAALQPVLGVEGGTVIILPNIRPAVPRR